MLEKLLKDNWKQVGNYAGFYILAREDKRLLYCPDEKKVIIEYNLGKIK